MTEEAAEIAEAAEDTGQVFDMCWRQHLYVRTRGVKEHLRSFTVPGKLGRIKHNRQAALRIFKDQIVQYNLYRKVGTFSRNIETSRRFVDSSDVRTHHPTCSNINFLHQLCPLLENCIKIEGNLILVSRCCCC